jgi:hypothetical protein
LEVIKIKKMGKVKEQYLGEMSQHEIDTYLYNKHLRDIEYEEWRQSDEYVDLVNYSLLDLHPQYSNMDVSDAINYAVFAVQVTPSEVGTDVYGKLLHEKVFEFLNQSYERN